MLEQRYATKEIRAAAEGKFSICGYSAKYNTVADIGGEFDESILVGAFNRVVSEGQDVKCLFNHDENIVLGRVANGTLKLRADDKGLWFECQLNPDSEQHKNVYASIQRGDINQCSFGFSVSDGGQRFSMQKNGKPLREIMQVEKLFDVSPVTYPAYPTGTSVQARSYFDVQARSAFDSAMLASITNMVAADKAYDSMVDAYLKNRAMEVGAAIAADDTDAANKEMCAAIAQRIAEEDDEPEDEREAVDEDELTDEERARITRLAASNFAQTLFEDDDF